MGIPAWIVVGLIAGFIAKALVPGREPGGFLATTAIGIVGAIVGGFLWNVLFNRAGATGVNLGSILVAVVGAIVVLVVYHMATGRRSA
jgi:uncharacterized membrane protein YeaQ/YmgE (transglycosylase-associated protein family)